MRRNYGYLQPRLCGAHGWKHLYRCRHIASSRNTQSCGFQDTNCNSTQKGDHSCDASPIVCYKLRTRQIQELTLKRQHSRKCPSACMLRSVTFETSAKPQSTFVMGMLAKPAMGLVSGESGRFVSAGWRQRISSCRLAIEMLTSALQVTYTHLATYVC